MKAIDLDTYDSISPKARKKAYRKEIEEIKEYYRPKKYRKTSKHKDWKTDWLGYAEYTYPWDGSCILELIVYRLEILRACIRHYSHHVGSDREIEELTDAIQLGRKIVNNAYDSEAQKFAKEHCAHVIYIYKKIKNGRCLKENLLGELIKWGDRDSDDLFYEADLDAWCEDQGINKKEIDCMYGGRWDEQKNHDVWLELVQAGNKQYEEDKKKFFALLAEKLESWWD